MLIVDGGATYPKASEQGVRWNHVGGRFETSLSFFDGFNHLPNIESRPLPSSIDVSGLPPPAIELLPPSAIELSRVYPALRSYGADIAVPTPVVTVKGEAAHFTSPTSPREEYVLDAVGAHGHVPQWE